MLVIWRVLQASHSQVPSLLLNSAQQCIRRMQNAGRRHQNEDAALLHLAVHKWNGSSLIHVLGTGKEENNVHDEGLTWKVKEILCLKPQEWLSLFDDLHVLFCCPLFSWGAEWNWAHLWVGPHPPAGRPGCRHHQPPDPADKDLPGSHYRLYQNSLTEGTATKDLKGVLWTRFCLLLFPQKLAVFFNMLNSTTSGQTVDNNSHKE